MTVQTLTETLGFTPILLPDGGREVTGGYAGDLLSWVMGRASEGDCWVTIMSNLNVAAVAQLIDVACIVFSEGVSPDAALVDAAKVHGINLLSAKEDTFTVCAKVAALLA